MVHQIDRPMVETAASKAMVINRVHVADHRQEEAWGQEERDHHRQEEAQEEVIHHQGVHHPSRQEERAIQAVLHHQHIGDETITRVMV